MGKRRIDEIKRKGLKAFLDNLLIKGLSRSTVALVKAPISGVLSHAVDSEEIESNPLNDLKLKHKKRVFSVEPLTEKEANQLLDQAKINQNGLAVGADDDVGGFDVSMDNAVFVTIPQGI